MTETYGKTKTRRQAIKRWTCPNHRDGPPTLPADGYEREELTVTEAYGDEFIAALGRLWCFWAHARFGIWNGQGDIVCQRCNRVVWKDAAKSAQYRRTHG